MRRRPYVHLCQQTLKTNKGSSLSFFVNTGRQLWEQFISETSGSQSCLVICFDPPITMIKASKSQSAASVLEERPPKVLAEESSESSSDDEPTSTNGDGTTTNGDEKTATSNSSGDKFTKQETKAVNRSKMLVYGALFIAAGAIGAITYVLTSNEEKSQFTRTVSFLRSFFVPATPSSLTHIHSVPYTGSSLSILPRSSMSPKGMPTTSRASCTRSRRP